MCGIYVYLKKKGFKSIISHGKLYESFMKIKHRGPDRSHFLELSEYGLCVGFHRLAIMDVSLRGDQPFMFEDTSKQIIVVCNGEIYNFLKLCEEYNLELHSGSDCEVILHLYRLIGLDAMIKKLEGEFSFCICEIDKESKEVKLYAGRDECGKRELYITGNENEILFCSELKASPYLFLNNPYFVTQFRPRHYLEISSLDNKLCDPENLKYTQWLNFNEISTTIYDLEEAKTKIRETIVQCVEDRMVSDREIACLLSGGLDSSLIVSIAHKYCERHGKILKTFSAGLENGSTDEKFAKMVAEYLGNSHNHVHVVFTEQQAVEALRDTIYAVESFDITTCRASIIQYLLIKWINENTDVHVINCGEGPDELGGYMYFHKAPSAEAFHQETLRLINDTHWFDAQRTGKTTAANRCEVRIPYLDKRFLKLVFSIDPILRMPTKGIEKWLIRESFNGYDYLPDQVLWRPKESLSDGCSEVTRSWYQILREYIDTQITDEEYETQKNTYKHLTPISKDAYYFRKIFTEHFGHHEQTATVVPYFWLPNWCDPNITEPSARILDVYKTAK